MDIRYTVANDPVSDPVVVRARKRRPIKQYTNLQWLRVVDKVKENRLKGWSMERISRNMSITLYRVRQALGSAGGYVPAVRDDSGAVIEKARFMKAAESTEIGTDEPEEVEVVIERSKAWQQELIPEQGLPKEVLELLELIPQMSHASAKFWLRQIVSNAPILPVPHG
mgnify:CR=1 FL=1